MGGEGFPVHFFFISNLYLPHPKPDFKEENTHYVFEHVVTERMAFVFADYTGIYSLCMGIIGYISELFLVMRSLLGFRSFGDNNIFELVYLFVF